MRMCHQLDRNLAVCRLITRHCQPAGSSGYSPNAPPAGESADQEKTGPDESEKVVGKSLNKRINIRV